MMARRWLMAMLALLLAACAGRLAEPAPGVVRVITTNPAFFSDARNHPEETERQRQKWVDELSGYLRECAEGVVAPEQQLDIRIRDVRRMGGANVGKTEDGQTVRVVYTPEIELDFVLRDKDGTTLREGLRTLRNDALLRNPREWTRDPLFEEKRLIRAWVEGEFGPIEDKPYLDRTPA